MLIAKALSFTYNESSLLLRDINFSCDYGENIAIIGRSGTGKTTLLNIVCGYETKYSGFVEFSGVAPQLAARRKMIGYVFQRPRLLPWLSAFQNIALPLQMHSKKRLKDYEAQVLEVMELAKIREAAALYPHELSGGMQTRVALARALVYRPNLLLLDEPFRTLDDVVKEELYSDLQYYLSRVKTAVVIVTHDIAEAIRLCDRVYTLNKIDSTDSYSLVNVENIPFPKPRNLDIHSSDIFQQTRVNLLGGIK